MHSPSQPVPWRAAIYAVALVYLGCDLYVFDGPIHRWIEEHRRGTSEYIDRAIREDWIATANGRPVTRTAHLQRIEEMLYLSGTEYAKLNTRERKQIRQESALELVDDLLLTEAVKRDRKRPTVPKEVAQQAVDRFVRHFPTKLELHAHLRSQASSANEAYAGVSRRLQELVWIEEAIADAVQVSPEEARAWYEENRDQIPIEECVRASHIFISSVGKPEGEAKKIIDEVAALLAEDASPAAFAALAESHSEDKATKRRGGDLDYFSKNRLPSEFCDRVFAMQSGEISAPIQTKIGWHIVRVVDKKPAREASFEELEAEIFAFLEGQKRDEAVDQLKKTLRDKANIQFFPKVIFAELENDNLFAPE